MDGWTYARMPCSAHCCKTIVWSYSFTLKNIVFDKDFEQFQSETHRNLQLLIWNSSRWVIYSYNHWECGEFVHICNFLQPTFGLDQSHWPRMSMAALSRCLILLQIYISLEFLWARPVPHHRRQSQVYKNSWVISGPYKTCLLVLSQLMTFGSHLIHIMLVGAITVS